MRRLAARDRFAPELRAWLVGKGVSEQVADAVLDHLRRRRFVDDDRAAEGVVRAASGKRAKGRERLRADLLRRGADADTADRALGGRTDEEELQTALGCLEARRFGPGDRAKAARFLAGRGFEEETIRRAIEERFGSEEDADAWT
ncbi:MAG: RecX family transcriptional regulator [Fimbriimonadales bacterium]|nr:RecX family transcriptional regulator [Fimbriimonadales bacterium]